MSSGFIPDILAYFEHGGFVMPPLAVATLVLWYFLGLRFITLQRGNPRSARILLERYRRGYPRVPRGIIDGAALYGVEIAARYGSSRRVLRAALEDGFSRFRTRLNDGRTMVRSITSVAPLAGLLGTVIGMIETFDSLAEMALFTQSGGIAGGISQALFTTQMGLAVAVPGIVVGRILDRRQLRLEGELDQIKEILCAESRRYHRRSNEESGAFGVPTNEEPEDATT